MSTYPHLVQIAWDTVSKLVDDWSKNPSYWDRESDIQSELRSRLSTVLTITGYGDVHLQEVEESGVATYCYSSVACNPFVSYTDQNKTNCRVHPDIVIWNSLQDLTSVPESWPILWACEIKYNSSNTSNWDVEKLGYLLDQNRIDFGCWLTFKIDDTLLEPKIVWKKNSHGLKLWTCTAAAPYRPV